MNTNQRKLIAALSLCAAVVPNLASAVAITGQGTWDSTLQGRDLDGNLATSEAYYDVTLNITWLANPFLAGTTMNWSTANAWAADLYLYTGIAGWRLPLTIDADGPDIDDLGNDGCDGEGFQGIDCGFNITSHSELSHMYYVTLGNRAILSTSGIGQYIYPLNTGPFYAFDGATFWSGTAYAQASRQNRYWYFSFEPTFNGGLQYYDVGTTSDKYAWAVHDGDVGAVVPSSVPIPAAALLLGSGLLGLTGMSCKRRQRHALLWSFS